jgi:hypothetical protein
MIQRKTVFDRNEVKQIQWLAAQYKTRPHGSGIPQEEFSAIVANNDELSRLISRLKGVGVYDSMSNTSIYLNDGILDFERNLAEILEEQKQPDRVDWLQSKARRNPWLAWPIITLAVLAALASFLNNAIDIYQKLKSTK